MNKKIKIITINLLLIFLSLIAIENIAKFIDKNRLQRKTLTIKKATSFDDIYDEAKIEFRSPEGLSYQKEPIIIFGCSYAFGLDLNKEETPSYKLSKLTKRPVYNRSYYGWGIQHMLYQITTDTISFSEIKSPKYIIYIFIPQHITRRLAFRRGSMINPILFLSYTLDDKNSLKRYNAQKDYWKGIYLVRKFDSFLFKFKKDKETITEQNNKFRLFRAHINEINKNLNKYYPNTKFIILLYEQFEHWTFKKEFWDEIKETGIIVINTKELTTKNLGGIDYILGENDLHPNAKAWDEILPKLVEKIEN